MHEREHLLRWLDAAASRLRFDHSLRAAAWLSSVVCAALLLQQLVAVIVPVTAVRSALLPLLVMSAITGCAFVLWRARRRPDAREAARAADTRAQLHDELRSAQWFAEAGEASPQIELLLQRACRSVQARPAHVAFPHRLPPALWLALILLAATLILLWRAPRLDWIRIDAPSMSVSANRATAPHALRPGASGVAREAPAARSAQGSEAERIWSKLQALAGSLPESAMALKTAVDSRDASRARRALEAMRAQGEAAAAAPAAKDQVSAEVAQGILDRLAQLLSEPGAAGPAEAAADQPVTGRITQQLREQIRQPQPHDDGGQRPVENALDSVLRALSRQNYGQRETARGRGEAGDESGPANSTGGAMGRRVGISRAGANDNEQRPEGNPTGAAEAEPVLGARTQRLVTQLEKVQVRGEPAEEEGTEEAFFAATRSQAAEADYLAARTARAQRVEGSIEGDSVPLEYRDAARRYTLSQHLKDAAARRRAESRAAR